MLKYLNSNSYVSFQALFLHAYKTFGQMYFALNMVIFPSSFHIM